MDAFEPLKRLSNPDNIIDRITEAEKANLVQPTQIGNNLEEMAGNTGDLIVGNLISPAPEVEVMDVTSTDFTGSFMSGEGATFGSDTYNVGGVNAGTLQWGAKQTDGKLTAGAGAVVQDENGISLYSSFGIPSDIKWYYTDGTQIASAGTSYTVGGGSSEVTLDLQSDKITAASNEISNISLRASLDGSTGPQIKIINNQSSGKSIVINDDSEDVDVRIESDGNANAIFVDAGNNRVGIMNGSPTVALDVTGAVTASSSITSNAFFNMGATNAQTINAGVITVTGGRCVVDTQGGAATDDLDTINGGTDGDLLVIYTTDSARDVTAKDGTGNLALAGDFIMTNIRDRLTLLKVGTIWVELSRSDNQ